MLREDLIAAVTEHSGLSLEIIANIKGANEGYSGFTFFEDTNSFYGKYENLIFDVLADETELWDFPNPFALLSHSPMAQHVIDTNSFKQFISWYALEVAARYLMEGECDDQIG